MLRQWAALVAVLALSKNVVAQRGNVPERAALVSSLGELGTALGDGVQHIVIQNHLDFSLPESAGSRPTQVITLPPSVKSITVRARFCDSRAALVTGIVLFLREYGRSPPL